MILRLFSGGLFSLVRKLKKKATQWWYLNPRIWPTERLTKRNWSSQEAEGARLLDWGSHWSEGGNIDRLLDDVATLLTSRRQIFRNCRHVQILRLNVTKASLQDLADFELPENMTDVSLQWFMGPSINKILPILKRLWHLRRFSSRIWKSPAPSIKLLCNIITEMKHLTYLHLHFDHFEIVPLQTLRDKVNEIILPVRPSFKFYTSQARSRD